ncbi:yjeF-like protein, hydroxyethylthiazole kinase-related [Pyrinomonas methylaliphatogenes]|jgi:NAD(P)H-hydrate epimerase|uniref:Bifunctional NAD(P)H-hydrate repair enzyme n=2 Tax=Pyrinomonas methylaliphatogenes TaxID=454194 RepID=A0A0B6WTZ4_9BACT|nr:yjeF-like protein, hydroxyethylthiazole kinase-related [Pyrinomonas methylaliphatogenes]
MRAIDRATSEQYATPSLLLMEAAATNAAREAVTLLTEGSLGSHEANLHGKRIAIICGRGNNGGDGAAVGRALWRQGARVEIILCGRLADAKGDAQINFEIARRLAAGPDRSLSFIECDTLSTWNEVAARLADCDLIIDALFGTGLTRPVEGAHRAVVERLVQLREARDRSGVSTPRILSLDLPSGLDADRAQPIGPAVRADVTVTFTAPKPANVLPPASRLNGRLVIAHIGSPGELIEASPSRLFLLEASDARAWLRRTRYAPGSYKNSHGHVLVVAGSRRFTGAAALTANAAMRSGAGLVTIAAPRSAIEAVAARLMPEVITAPIAETAHGTASVEAVEEVLTLAERMTLIAIGPGLDASDEATRRFVREVIVRRRVPVVIDADGLNALAPWPSDLRGSDVAPLILTPHPGEMRRLIGTAGDEMLQDRVEAARDFATKHELHVVLKGERALIASADGRVFVNPTGNAGLGTAGSGDTLTGIIAGFLAQELAARAQNSDPIAAVNAAVYIGGLAGDLAARARGMRTMTASDVREHLSEAVLQLDAEGELPS